MNTAFTKLGIATTNVLINNSKEFEKTLAKSILFYFLPNNPPIIENILEVYTSVIFER